MRIGTARSIGIRRVCALMIALALVFVGFAVPVTARAESDGMLRVKLTRLGAPKTIVLTADCDYTLASDPTVRVPAGETATITAEGGGMTLSLGDRSVALGDTAKLMREKPGNCGIRFTQPELSNRFCGDLGLSASDGVITAILNIYIENYLYGVVGYAMPPSAGLEALKAEAVVARTVALRRKATRADAAYDIADNADQVFKGCNDASDYANVVRAVDETKGGVLYYDGSLAQCAACASNGGQTESSKNAGGPALDYSVVRDDPYDFESKTAAVRTAVVNKDLTGISDELYDALTQGVRDQLDGAESFRLLGVESVTACESRYPAPSRLYKSLTFKLRVSGRDASGAEQTGSVSVSIPTYGAFEDWYGLSINPEANETVWVVEGERAFNISFRRSGSGVGLSLRGAQVMAEKKMRASEILSFYFPGVEGRRLSLSDSARSKAVPGPTPAQQPIATARLSQKTDLLDAADDSGTAVATVAAGAVADVYAAQGEWVAVGSSGKYGFIRADSLEGISLAGGGLTRPEATTYGRATAEVDVKRLPAAAAQTVGALSAGEVVKVAAWTDQWRMVSYQGEAGFVPADALEVREAEAVDDDAADATPEDPDAFVAAGSGVSAVLKQDAPLFDYPNELSSIIENLKAGDAVTVLAYSRAWARVRTKAGREGCLRLESVTAVEDETTTASDVEGGAIRKVKGKKYLFVTAGSAPVYATWDTGSEVIQTVYYGEKVRVGAYNSLWACVRVGDLTGYMRMDALAEQKPAALEGGSLVRAAAGLMGVAKADATAYASASPDARQALTLEKGQRVAVVAYNAA
ncbi:MAG: SpoIID/LytB domain-containing protein, partial [Clostridia bacterium]|nr:SpoIID/LytB domain-containing protein [Clostridia bacterium]